MGLSIKNYAVEAMIRDLAAARGVSMTEAIRVAVEAELARAVEDQAEILADRRKKMMIILTEAHALPRLNTLTDDEVIGYDDHGLPA